MCDGSRKTQPLVVQSALEIGPHKKQVLWMMHINVYPSDATILMFQTDRKVYACIKRNNQILDIKSFWYLDLLTVPKCISVLGAESFSHYLANSP